MLLWRCLKLVVVMESAREAVDFVLQCGDGMY
jgi:hypothetical protein